MMKNIAAREAANGITANAVSPAMIEDTGMIPKESETAKGIAQSIPIGRCGQPEEVAASIVMLASNGYITGQDLVLSGGLK